MDRSNRDSVRPAEHPQQVLERLPVAGARSVSCALSTASAACAATARPSNSPVAGGAAAGGLSTEMSRRLLSAGAAH